MQTIIEATSKFVRAQLVGAEGGHDWLHTERVWKMARKIAQTESCDHLIVELSALLHDVADSKFHDGDEELGPRIAEAFLREHQQPERLVEHVGQVVRHMSFKGGNEAAPFTSIEMRVVQDADRLDAIGAIGIARAFAYGGYKQRLLYDPAIPAQRSMTREEYKRSAAPTINHFYEKLLLLRDRMHTAEGRKQAEERHRFMLLFLEQFYIEIGESSDSFSGEVPSNNSKQKDE